MGAAGRETETGSPSSEAASAIAIVHGPAAGLRALCPAVPERFSENLLGPSAFPVSTARPLCDSSGGPERFPETRLPSLCSCLLLNETDVPLNFASPWDTVLRTSP